MTRLVAGRWPIYDIIGRQIRRACACMRLGWLCARARAQLTEIRGCGGTMLMRRVKSSAYTSMHY